MSCLAARSGSVVLVVRWNVYDDSECDVYLHINSCTLDDGDEEEIGVVGHLLVGHAFHEGIDQHSTLTPPALAL